MLPIYGSPCCYLLHTHTHTHTHTQGMPYISSLYSGFLRSCNTVPSSVAVRNSVCEKITIVYTRREAGTSFHRDLSYLAGTRALRELHPFLLRSHCACIVLAYGRLLPVDRFKILENRFSVWYQQPSVLLCFWVYVVLCVCFICMFYVFYVLHLFIVQRFSEILQYCTVKCRTHACS